MARTLSLISSNVMADSRVSTIMVRPPSETGPGTGSPDPQLLLCWYSYKISKNSARQPSGLGRDHGFRLGPDDPIAVGLLTEHGLRILEQAQAAERLHQGVVLGGGHELLVEILNRHWRDTPSSWGRLAPGCRNYNNGNAFYCTGDAAARQGEFFIMGLSLR